MKARGINMSIIYPSRVEISFEDRAYRCSRKMSSASRKEGTTKIVEHMLIILLFANSKADHHSLDITDLTLKMIRKNLCKLKLH